MENSPAVGGWLTGVCHGAGPGPSDLALTVGFSQHSWGRESGLGSPWTRHSTQLQAWPSCGSLRPGSHHHFACSRP